MKTKFCNVHIPDMEKVCGLLNTYSSKDRMSNFGPVYEKLCVNLYNYLSLPEHKEIMCVSSGHIAIMTALSALGSKSVLVPAYTFSSTLQAASLQGIKTSVIDVSDKYPYITVEEVSKAKRYGIEFDTVIFVAPVSIVPESKLRDLEDWCRLHGVKLVIDGAATFGTDGVCDIGDAYCLSFHATKSFPVGEGGAVILNREFIPAARSFICFGMDSNRNIIRPGLNGKISEYTAAVAVCLLEEIDAAIQKRLINSALFYKGLKSTICRVFDSAPDTVFQSFPVYTDRAPALIAALKGAGIEVNKYYTPLAIRPNANSFYNDNVCFPCHPDVSQEEVEKMLEIIKEVCDV